MAAVQRLIIVQLQAVAGQEEAEELGRAQTQQLHLPQAVLLLQRLQAAIVTQMIAVAAVETQAL